jgi:hypothetical protein
LFKTIETRDRMLRWLNQNWVLSLLFAMPRWVWFFDDIEWLYHVCGGEFRDV